MNPKMKMGVKMKANMNENKNEYEFGHEFHDEREEECRDEAETEHNAANWNEMLLICWSPRRVSERPGGGTGPPLADVPDDLKAEMESL
jgi:hypothetical protein